MSVSYPIAAAAPGETDAKDVAPKFRRSPEITMGFILAAVVGGFVFWLQARASA